MFPPGVDSISHYEQALRQVRYRNWRPASLSERRFRLTCSELNGRYTSNEFNMEVRLALLAPDLRGLLLHLSFFFFFLVLQVSLLHQSAPVEHVNHMAANPQYMRPVHHPLMIHTFNSHMSGASKASKCHETVSNSCNSHDKYHKGGKPV